jgi:hypothetical protein
MTREQLDALPEETLRRVIILPAYCSPFEHAPGSVGPLTYSVRAGPTTGGNIDLNTTLGSAARTTLILEEIHV